MQAGRAQTRFYTELENWLSSVTDLSSDIAVAEPDQSGTADDIRLIAERLRGLQENGGSNQRVANAMANLADGISGLVKNMRNEQQMMRDWVEAQSDEQKRDALDAGEDRRCTEEPGAQLMALARGRRTDRRIDYWPGFVDALSTLLLTFMFLLSVFVLAQFLARREITGKDEVLTRLNSQINELTQLSGA